MLRLGNACTTHSMWMNSTMLYPRIIHILLHSTLQFRTLIKATNMQKLKLISRLCILTIILLVLLDIFFNDSIKGGLFVAWTILLATCLFASIVIEIVIRRKKKHEKGY